MAHLTLQSGVPKTLPSGVTVGATNFSEFPLGVGLPAGITAFGSTTSRPDPNLVEIGFDSELEEQGLGGQHFAMTGRGPENWGYGLDSFFGQMDRGEMRAIVRSDYRGGFEDFTIGPCAGMEGANNADWRAWIGTQFLRQGVNDIESVYKGTFAGFGNTMFQSIAEDVQEPFIAGLQFQILVRRIPNVGDPSRDDLEIRSWYGGVGAEPVAPDGTSSGQQQTGAGAQAIGWGQLPQGPFNPVLQKIRFLSFSDNPLVEPAPAPSDIGAASVWVPSGNQLPIATDWEATTPKLIPGGPKPLIAGLEFEHDVRVLSLSDGDTVAVWPDSSGNGNDLVPQFPTTPSFELNGWTFGVNAVRLQDGINPNVQENFLIPDVSAFFGTEVTFFQVFQVEDLSDGCALIGAKTSATPPRNFDHGVDIDGTAFFNKNHLPRDVETAPGAVVEGRKYIMTTRLLNATGMIMRLNGELVGSRDDPNARTNIVGWTDPRLGQTRAINNPAGEYGVDKLIVWASGYTSAASDAEIEAMESFLAGVFQINFGTEWVRS